MINAALYPGSFDPLTVGHINIVERAAKMFDKVIVCIFYNYTKKTLFTKDERLAMLIESLKHLDNVVVDTSDKMLVDYAADQGVTVLIKGLRNTQDFIYESEMAWANHRLNDQIESVFLMAEAGYQYLSSSVVKEMVAFEGDISGLVPPNVEIEIKNKLGRKSMK
jgi:pantetheine-phosphate adenylyltransferase